MKVFELQTLKCQKLVESEQTEDVIPVSRSSGHHVLCVKVFYQ